MDPYSGTPADAYDFRMNAPPRLGHTESKWFAYDEKYWISFLPFMEYDGDSLATLELYPFHLGQDKPRSQKGRPGMAYGKLAEKILGIIKNLSKPYGTEIIIKDGVGSVKF
jgi:hypothetical protein